MARPIDADALLKALNKIDSDNKLVTFNQCLKKAISIVKSSPTMGINYEHSSIFKIGDKVVCERDGKIQIITQIEKVEYTTKDN